MNPFTIFAMLQASKPANLSAFGIGAAVGGLLGGGTGAAIGATAGAGTGVAVAGSGKTRLRVPAETVLRFQLNGSARIGR